MSDAEKIARLRLARTKNVGPITFRQLLARYGSATRALAALPDLARRGGGRKALTIASHQTAEAELENAAAAGLKPLFLGLPGYPGTLAHIEDAPPILYYAGNSALGARNAIAVVGARNASAAGLGIARDLSAALGAAGLVVASGLARGIDTAAHKAALASGTVAVLAGGADIVYPPENQTLYEAIRAEGAIIAEMPPGTRPQARHFPRRNRLISGLSLGVLVIEAATRSGSLITARFGLEQGREVFAVPGSPLDPRAGGTNHLIRQGAVLVRSAEDVMEVLRPALRRPLQEPEETMLPASGAVSDSDAIGDDQRGRVSTLLSPAPVSIDALIRQSELTSAVVLTILLELELAGAVVRHPGNRVSSV